MAPFDADGVHGVKAHEEHLCGLHEHNRHGAWLQLAQLEDKRVVEDLHIRGSGQSEHLSKHRLDYHVVKGDLLLFEHKQRGGAETNTKVIGQLVKEH